MAEVRDGITVESLGTSDVNRAFDRALAFVSDAWEGRLHDELEPSTPAADLARLIFEHRTELKTVRVIVVSNAILGTRFRLVDRSAIEGVKIELNVWDLTRFQRLAGTGGREEIDIDLCTMTAEGLPALPAGIGNAHYEAYLCVVPGDVLADIYEQYGSRILEGNVRAFLSARGKVNQGIRRTIIGQPDRFFAFNNGITATASRVDRSPNGNIVRIIDLQIVNGGQTTASLFNTRVGDKTSLSRVFVQMKLSVLPADVAMVMIPEISRFANTQNKVSDADLFANHPFNRRVEELSRRIWVPARAGAQQMTHWFYERARAQYQTEQLKLSQAQKRAFLLQNPKDQVITKTDLAKFENSYLMQPHIVSLGAQKNFIKYAEQICTTFEEHPDDFNERWFQHLVAKAMLFSETERIVSKASWYVNSYRANIVTYAIAKFVHSVNQHWPNRIIDLDQIWKDQELPEAIKTQLEAAARVSQGVLLQPPQEGANITEWAKKKECWERTAGATMSVNPGVIRYLKEIGEERDDRRRARGAEREGLAVNATLEVVNRSQQGFWTRALAHRLTKEILSPLELGILETAARKGVNWVPSDAQARRLLDAARRLEDSGVS